MAYRKLFARQLEFDDDSHNTGDICSLSTTSVESCEPAAAVAAASHTGESSIKNACEPQACLAVKNGFLPIGVTASCCEQKAPYTEPTLYCSNGTVDGRVAM